MATDAQLRSAVADWLSAPGEATIDRTVRLSDCYLEELVDRNTAWGAFKTWVKNSGIDIPLNHRAIEFNTAMRDHVEVYFDNEESRHYYVGLKLHYGDVAGLFDGIEI